MLWGFCAKWESQLSSNADKWVLVDRILRGGITYRANSQIVRVFNFLLLFGREVNVRHLFPFVERFVCDSLQSKRSTEYFGTYSKHGATVRCLLLLLDATIA